VSGRDPLAVNGAVATAAIDIANGPDRLAETTTLVTELPVSGMVPLAVPRIELAATALPVSGRVPLAPAVELICPSWARGPYHAKVMQAH
jgi:hypothetical protein